MAHEAVELLERALVDQQLDPLAGRQLAEVVLAIDGTPVRRSGQLAPKRSKLFDPLFSAHDPSPVGSGAAYIFDSRRCRLATRYSLISVDTVPSTQDVARLAFRDDRSRPVLVTAKRQEAGRGRTGIGWINADRAVAASLAFDAPATPHLGTIPLVAGLAMRSALDEVGVRVMVKWPNDLMDVDGVKVGGILSESDGEIVVIGAGVNLYFENAPAGMAGCFPSDPGRHVAERVATIWADRLLDALASDRPWNRKAYREASMLLGAPITWEGGSGTAVDVADDGALVVAVGTERVELHSGAVRLVRRATLAADTDDASREAE